MPNYQYACRDCGQRYELTQTIAEMEAKRDSLWCRMCEGRLVKQFSVPALKTTTRLMSGSADGLPDMASRKIAYAKAQAAGVNISGKKFHPGLCRRGVPFDPNAWYSDETEVVKKAQALGRNVEGSINFNAPIRDEHYAALEKPYRVAEHIVADDVEHEIEVNHGGKVSRRKRKELTEKYQDKHSGSSAAPAHVSLTQGL